MHSPTQVADFIAALSELQNTLMDQPPPITAQRVIQQAVSLGFAFTTVQAGQIGIHGPGNTDPVATALDLQAAADWLFPPFLQGQQVAAAQPQPAPQAPAPAAPAAPAADEPRALSADEIKTVVGQLQRLTGQNRAGIVRAFRDHFGIAEGAKISAHIKHAGHEAFVSAALAELEQQQADGAEGDL